MKLFSTLLRPASARNSASASASPSGAGSAIGRLRTIDGGTTASISACRDAAPTTDSMCRSSASSGPTWRWTNSLRVSSSARGSRADINISGGLSERSERLQQRVVGGPVHQLVELAHVGDVDLEEPAVAHRVLVGERRVSLQRVVDLDDLAL